MTLKVVMPVGYISDCQRPYNETMTTNLKTRRRRRRDQRLANPPRMQVTERDKHIIQAVAQYRVLRQDQIQVLFFGQNPGAKAAAQRRLVKLYDGGFLARFFLPTRGGLMSSPILYGLDRRGIELLRAEWGYEDLRWYPTSKALKDDFLEHTLAIADIRVAVTVACHRLGYALLTWRGEAELKADYDYITVRTAKGYTKSVSVIPDSYFVLDTPLGKAHFFLEVDRGTMTTERFRTKIAAYMAYQHSGSYERRYGTRSLRVLTVTLGEQRLTNLMRVTEQVGGKQWFWFATLSQLAAQQVLSAPVWQVAGLTGHLPLIEPT